MNIVKLAIKRPILILVLFFIVILLGFFSLPRLKVDLAPRVDIPIITVITVYPGAGPDQVQTLVTKPIEDAISTTNNLKNIRSSSIEGVSIVIAEFKMGSSVDIAATDVREKVSSIVGQLPSDAKQPEILKVDINAQPVLYLSVSGSDLKRVYDLTENLIKLKLQTVPGVGKIDIMGGEKREIRVVTDPEKLAYYGIDITNIAQRLKLENINIPSGHYVIGDREVSGRVNTEFLTPDEISLIDVPVLDMSIGSVRTVPLAAIAHVYDTIAEQRDKTRTNGKDSVGITIQKQPDANTIEVADNVRKIIPEIQKLLPQDVKINVVVDTSEFIKDAVRDVWHKLFIAAILTGLILFAFLYSIGSTLIVCVAIPVSLIGTLFLCYISGFTLNIMTLSSLAVSVGIVVDSSIVIIENIHRRRKELKESKEIAAEKGATEVASAVSATMITHMVVFLPIVFMSGLVGQFFKEFGMVQVYTTLLALAVGFTLTPMLTTKFLKETAEKEWAKKAENKFNSFRNGYRSTLSKFLKNPKWVLLIVAILIPASFMLVPLIGFEMVTNADEGMYTVSITMPPGTSLEKTESIVKKIEQKVLKQPETEVVFSSIGKVIGTFAGLGAQGPEYAQIQVKLKDKRDKSTDTIIEELKPFIASIPGTITIAPQRSIGGAGSRPPLEFYVTGTDEKEVIQVSKQLLDIMKSIPGISDADSSYKPGKPEISFVVKRAQLAEYNLSSNQVAMVCRAALEGIVPTKFRVGNNEYDIRVTIPENLKSDLKYLENLPVVNPMQNLFFLKQVAEIKQSYGPTTKERYDRKYSITMFANINKPLGTVIKSLDEEIRKLNLPESVSIIYGGMGERMTEAFRDLFLAIILAVLLVYLVMAAQFESWVEPFIIMGTLPLSIIGILTGLFITGKTINIFSLMGIIVLVGIVVSNGILIINFAKNLINTGRKVEDAILEASMLRLRPILMTTLSMVGGMLPLALAAGKGSAFKAPMAVAVISGLLSSTMLTLFIIPLVYLYYAKKKYRT
ncbi:MAG: efflux RND transporter permease subunit [Candidatus Omnitrophica bacterium]|nr:efflux RND transporter permease subunit [Candidatus Omnitrophota bacterium]